MVGWVARQGRGRHMLGDDRQPGHVLDGARDGVRGHGGKKVSEFSDSCSVCNIQLPPCDGGRPDRSSLHFQMDCRCAHGKDAGGRR
ncbi:MAG: hypothetical protein CL454_00140 [Acidimicrobiaceae bacterium]|nr:hypothetical protein [Acidimicrobiaceae bacterium]